MRAIRFNSGVLNYTMDLIGFRRKSKGWETDPPAYIHSRILFGHGFALTPEFANQHKITHVINCAFDINSPPWFREKYPTKYKCLNAIDSLDANIITWYAEFEKTLHAFLREEGSKNVYIHCQCGINRSGFLSLAFMCKRLGIDFKTGIRTILTQRPSALTNTTYKEQVYRFSEQK
jgi:hypothetical protein